MTDLEKQNSLIVTEANKILYENGLLRTLGRYGKPVPWGSYVLGLMTWRDLDIYLETDEMNESRFFQLGAEIASLLRPQRMHYRNEFIGKTPGNPQGYYWGTYLVNDHFPEEWKIDLWAIDADQLRNYAKQFDDLKTRIDKERRAAILEIKNHFCRHPEYRRRFTSVDIYRGVLENSIKSVEEFAAWLEANKGISTGG